MKIRWSPRLRPKILSPDCAILLSETETLSLCGKEYKHVIDSIENGVSIHRLNSLGLYESASVIFTVDKLINKNLIEQVQSDNSDEIDQQSNYCYPDFEKNHGVKETLTDNIELILLTEWKGFDWRESWLAGIKFSQKLTLVIVDDYLDPRLNQINEIQRETKRPWIIFKVTGHQVMAGPLFYPELNHAPCWQCLMERMYRNQPARIWLSRIEDSFPCRLPVKIHPDEIIKSLTLLKKPVTELINKEMPGELISLSLSSSTIKLHSVTKRPQCKCCGNPILVRQQIEKPIKLQTNNELSSFDGGYRTEIPKVTLARLKPFISPITGAIANIEPLNIGSLVERDFSNLIQIYQSSFYKSPYLINSLKTDPFIQVSLGKGLDDLQSQTSALCEAFERYAAQYQGDEPSIHAKPSELEYPSILPHHLAPYSDEQYRAFSQIHPAERESHHAVLNYSEDKAIPWTPGWSLTYKQFCYLPTTYCFANTPFEEICYSRWNSNGCAAGNSLEEAIMQGFLELVERDAVAIWWYNKIVCHSVDLDILPVEHIQKFNATIEADWDYWVLNISHDLGIPVMVAVAQHKLTGKFSLGFGCHLDVCIAIERALTELCQLIPIREHSYKQFNFDDIKPESYLYPLSSLMIKPETDYDFRDNFNLKKALEYCLDRAQKRGLETIILNYSRPDIPLFTVKVLVPGLCHIWPQMACERLYSVPVQMGWVMQPLKAADMNPLKLFI